MIERVANEHHHDDPGLDRDGKQRDVSDDDGRRHRVAQHPLKKHAADHGKRHRQHDQNLSPTDRNATTSSTKMITSVSGTTNRSRARAAAAY